MTWVAEDDSQDCLGADGYCADPGCEQHRDELARPYFTEPHGIFNTELGWMIDDGCVVFLCYQGVLEGWKPLTHIPPALLKECGPAALQKRADMYEGR